jgi:hypothetical protein
MVLVVVFLLLQGLTVYIKKIAWLDRLKYLVVDSVIVVDGFVFDDDGYHWVLISG